MNTLIAGNIVNSTGENNGVYACSENTLLRVNRVFGISMTQAELEQAIVRSENLNSQICRLDEVLQNEGFNTVGYSQVIASGTFEGYYGNTWAEQQAIPALCMNNISGQAVFWANPNRELRKRLVELEKNVKAKIRFSFLADFQAIYVVEEDRFYLMDYDKWEK